MRGSSMDASRDLDGGGHEIKAILKYSCRTAHGVHSCKTAQDVVPPTAPKALAVGRNSMNQEMVEHSLGLQIIGPSGLKHFHTVRVCSSSPEERKRGAEQRHPSDSALH